MKKIIAEFEKYYKAASNVTLNERDPKVPKLRASGFPFCGLQYVYKKLSGQLAEQHETINFSKSFFTSVGTVAHETFQRYLGSGGQVVGSWKCHKCNHVRPLSTNHICICGNEMEYVELEIRAFRHVSGHVDGVWRASDGTYWIIDYKTSSTFGLQKHEQTGNKFPYSWNRHQIEAYCTFVDLKYGIPISGWMLCYVPRDNPFRNAVVGARVSEKKKSQVYDLVQTYDNHWEMIHKEPSIRWRTVIQLIEEKPCSSCSDYEKNWRGFEDCPLAKVCFNSKRLEQRMKDLMQGKI